MIIEKLHKDLVDKEWSYDNFIDKYFENVNNLNVYHPDVDEFKSNDYK